MLYKPTVKPLHASTHYTHTHTHIHTQTNKHTHKCRVLVQMTDSPSIPLSLIHNTSYLAASNALNMLFILGLTPTDDAPRYRIYPISIKYKKGKDTHQ